MRLALLERYVKEGELTLIEPDGRTHRFGHGSPTVTWIMRKPDALGRILRHPAFELGETYMEEGWDVADGDLRTLLGLLRRNVGQAALQPPPLASLARLLQSWNHLTRSFRNVARHYDLDETLFRAFLDSDMHYSCAYFTRPDETLEAAQQAKCRHIAAKLALEDGQRILDIGCGWGGLAFHLARQRDVTVTGLTLSKEQLRVATAEAERRGLADRVTFRLQDYRQHDGRYDRIVSVGMFEHVGRHYYRAFFRTLADLLAAQGCVLLHTIGSTRPPEPTNAWFRRYIFPGGYIPPLSDVSAAIEHSPLMATDVEILRDHYALTLDAWNQRFQARRAEFVASHGETFCRMWEFYLVASATAFECRELVVQQWQLAPADTRLPLTRDYIYRRCQ